MSPYLTNTINDLIFRRKNLFCFLTDTLYNSWGKKALSYRQFRFFWIKFFSRELPLKSVDLCQGWIWPNIIFKLRLESKWTSKRQLSQWCTYYLEYASNLKASIMQFLFTRHANKSTLMSIKSDFITKL